MTDGHSHVPKGWGVKSYTCAHTRGTQKYLCIATQSFDAPAILIFDLPFFPGTAN